MSRPQPVIVCGVDGSPAGERALRWAIEEAARRNATVRAVTAWSWDGVEELGARAGPADALSRARQVLDTAVDHVLGEMANPPVVERVCQRGFPSEALCSASADAELMVLGSHGHSAVHDKLVGSTIERAIHHAPCTVVIVPDPRHAQRNLERARTRRRGERPDHPVQVV